MATLTPRGEKQINFLDSSTDGLLGTQADPAVTALSNGNFVIVYDDPASGNIANIDLLAHFFAPNGNAIAPPATTTLSNGVVGVDQTLDVTVHPAIAATANGGFVVAYSDMTAGTIDAETYNPATGMSQPFTVFSKIGRVNTQYLDSASIATFADGNILVAWDEVLSAIDHNVDDAILNPTATGFVVAANSVTSFPTFQGESRIATSGNTAALVYADDFGTVGGGQDIVLNFLNSTGTALAAPTVVFGTNSADVWSHPDVAALPDGRFVVVAEDDTTGNFSVAVVDPATHTVLSTLVPTTGTNPHVAVTGNGFTVSLDANGDVFYFNFSVGSGTAPVLGTFGNVGSFFTGIQDENAIAANANGSLFFTWQDAGPGNPNSTDTDTRIEGQAFESAADDHAPVTTAADFTAMHGQNIAASSLFSVTDADNDAITAYQFWDDTADPASGHWVVGGAAQPTGQRIDVTPAQLAGATFQSGSGSDDLFVRANDGINWGNWAEFHVNAPIDAGPTLSVANLTATIPGGSYSGFQLFSNYMDPFGSPATQYDFWNAGTSGGHFLLGTTVLGANQDNFVPASALLTFGYQTGSGTDTLWVRANDGTVWGKWSSPFTVTTPIDDGPTVSVANLTANHGQSLLGSALFTYSDPFGLGAASYDFWDTGDGGGHFVLNGTALGANQHNIIYQAQLPQLTYQSGSGADKLWVRANDNVVWGSWSSAFTVTAPIDPGPTLFVADQTVAHGASISANSLALYSDPFNSPATLIDYWDTGAGGGHFVFNGTALGANQHNIVTVAQLPQLSYQSGSGADTLWIRANDGTVWGSWSNGFTVTAPIDSAPVVNVSNVALAHGNANPLASSLFSVSDAEGDSITTYGFWDNGAGGGQFVLNGVAQANGKEIDVTAAQLAQLRYQAGSGTDTLWVKANDGIQWGGWSSPFMVTAPPDQAPVVTGSDIVTTLGAQGSAASLFSVTDADHDTITQYDLWDTGAGGGHFVMGGNALGTNQHNIMTAAQLSQTSYVAGSGTDTLWVRANDGMIWGGFSNSFTVTG